MTYDIGLFVGALAITFLLIRGAAWLLRKIEQDRLGLAHFLVAILSIVAAAYGSADGGEPKFLYGASVYGPACLVWFVIDFYRRNRHQPSAVEGERKALNKPIQYAAYALSFAVAFGIFYFVGQFLRTTVTQQEMSVAEALELAVTEVRKQVPMKVNEMTTLEDVSSIGEVFQYHYRLEFSEKDIGVDEFRTAMTQTLRESVCSNEDMRMIMEDGGSYEYIYKGLDGVLIDTIIINVAMC